MEQIPQFFSEQPILGAVAIITMLLIALGVYYNKRADRRAVKQGSQPKQPSSVHVEQHGQGSVGVVEGSLTQAFNSHPVPEDKK